MTEDAEHPGVGLTGRPPRNIPEPQPKTTHGPAKVIAMCNQKGGVGKTTSTINLGASLAEYGRRVLLVDLDPQGALSAGLGVPHYELDATIHNVLVESRVSLDDVMVHTKVRHLDLVPSNIDLSAAEIQLVNEVGREQTLGRALYPVLDRYDYVLIDCQPSLGLLTVNALACADGVVIPTECEYFSLRGLALLTDTVDKVHDRLNPKLHITGIVITRFDTRTVNAREVMARVVERFGDLVFDTVITRTVRFPGDQCGRRTDHHVGTEIRWRGRLSVVGARGDRPVRRRVTSTDSAPTFHVRLSNFEGPFDLLLQLIFAHRLDVTEVALHQVTDEFIAYTKAIGSQLELDETTAFFVVAATLLDLKAARLLPAGEVEDAEDIALLEVRDLLFARLLQYRAFKHVAEMFAELEAAALRSYPRAVSLEDRYADLLPEVMLGVDPMSFAQLAATALTPRPVPTIATEHLHETIVSIPEQAGQLLDVLERRGPGQWATFSELVADCAEPIQIVGRFLALLELYRLRAVAFDQSEPLGVLQVSWTGDRPTDDDLVKATHE